VSCSVFVTFCLGYCFIVSKLSAKLCYVCRQKYRVKKSVLSVSNCKLPSDQLRIRLDTSRRGLTLLNSDVIVSEGTNTEWIGKIKFTTNVI